MRLTRVCGDPHCQPIWEAAVFTVDRRHRYTVEFAPHADAHRYEYELEAEQIAGGDWL